MSTPQFYPWQSYRCAYDRHVPAGTASGPPIVLIHPIGVGLSRQFWQRFIEQWSKQGNPSVIYNPDLLGCGASSMPRAAYQPDDWGAQLEHFVKTVVREPVILVIQGALAPVALACVARFPELIRGMVWSGPPAWRLITTPTQPGQQKLAWNLFDTPAGTAFYRYARREQFLRSFSQRQLFGNPADVDQEWLNELHRGSRDLNSRHAVFAFLSGFWRQDYGEAIATIPCPTLVLFGEGASSVTRGYREAAGDRLQAYLDHLPQGKGEIIPGRNVLPYESTAIFVDRVGKFIRNITS